MLNYLYPASMVTLSDHSPSSALPRSSPKPMDATGHPMASSSEIAFYQVVSSVYLWGHLRAVIIREKTLIYLHPEFQTGTVTTQTLNTPLIAHSLNVQYLNFLYSCANVSSYRYINPTCSYIFTIKSHVLMTNSPVVHG